MSEMPRSCKNGADPKRIELCKTKNCWRYMHAVCHPEQKTLTPAKVYPEAKIIYGFRGVEN